MQNAKMSDFTESVHTAYGDGLNKFLDERDEERGYYHFRGIVRHDLGDVIFNQYKQWPTGHKHSANKEWRVLSLELYHKGSIHHRKWQAWYGEKTIAQLANEFIEEIKGEGS